MYGIQAGSLDVHSWGMSGPEASRRETGDNEWGRGLTGSLVWGLHYHQSAIVGTLRERKVGRWLVGWLAGWAGLGQEGEFLVLVNPDLVAFTQEASGSQLIHPCPHSLPISV